MDDNFDDYDILRNSYKSEAIRKKKLRRNYLTQKKAEYSKAAKERCERLKLAALKNAIDNNTEEAIEIGRLNYDEEAVQVPVLDINSATETHPEYSYQNYNPDAEDCSLNLSKENSDLGVTEGYSSGESEDNFAAFHYGSVEPDAPGTLWDDLRIAATSTNMTTTQVDAILAALHKHPREFRKLPKSCKTLLKVYSTIPQEIKSKSGHDYFYMGLEEQLNFILKLYPESDVKKHDTLLITVNNDGLPLFKSNNISCWPLLVRIDNFRPKKVFPVAVTAGPGKPHDLEYVNDFINEARQLMINGFVFQGKKYLLGINAVVCDAPARAHVKHVRQYSAKFGCDQCESKGFYDGKRMIWPRTSNLPLRTDASFRAKSQPDHHKNDGKETPFLQLSIDMVRSFPPDFMHQGGGCIKKLLMWNVLGPKTSGTGRPKCRMSTTNIVKLNKRMTQMREFIPNCFSRKPRSFHDFAYFKATELRLLQLYTAKIVFKNLMASKKIYQNLVTYNTVCALLVDDRTAQPYSDFCQLVMQQFVDGCEEIYGSSFLVYNVHAQLHFPEVAKTHGSIDNVSAYAFESKLGEFKKMVRSSHRPIVSLMKGIQKQQATEGEVKTRQAICIYTKAPNNIYINIQENKCYQAIISHRESVTCIEFLDPSPFYTYPIDSRKIGCYRVQTNHYRYITVTATYIMQCRRGMRVDLWKLEGMDGPENEDTSVFMSVLHDQDHCLF